MPMTPEEYAAKELNVPGWDTDEPVYVPDSESGGVDPNVFRVMQGGAPASPPASEATITPEILAMQHEYNFVLPIAMKRAEIVSEVAKGQHLSARANFWDSLALAVTMIFGLGNSDAS